MTITHITMMSLSDFFMRPSGGSRSVVVEDLERILGGAFVSGPILRRSPVLRQGDQLSVSGGERVRLRGGWHVR